jgi:hypothetical protein
MRPFRVLTSVLAAAVVAGCDSEPTTPTVSVDAVLSQMSSTSVAGYSAAAASAGGVVVPNVTASGPASACAYNSSNSFFVCPPVTSNGMTMNRSFQLLDASGAPLSSPNPLALAAVRSVTDISGSTTTTGATPATIEVTRHEDATLSGLLGANRVLNAHSTQRIAATGSSISFISNDTSATTNLQLPKSPDQKYPLGGTIVTDRTATISSVATTTQHSHEEISFDGSSIMTVKITLGTSTTVTRTCKVDLANRGVAPVCT